MPVSAVYVLRLLLCIGLFADNEQFLSSERHYLLAEAMILQR